MTRTLTNSLAAVEEEPSQDRPMRPFFILWTGQSLSLVGSQAVQFALIWWLTETSGSATILATATLLGLLPPIVLGPVIGTLVDRWSRKTVMLAADGFVAAASLLLAWLFSAGIADVPHVLALVFLRALGAAFHSPAMTASTTLMVPEKHLTRIQGLNQSMQGLLTIAGAPLGALLLAIFSMTGVMMIDVGTALLAILPLLAIRVPRPTRSDGLGQSSVSAETAAGFRYLVRLRGHRTLIAMCALINALLVPASSLLPLLVLQRLNGGAAQFGWLASSFGAGLIAGGVALGAWGGFRKRIVTTLTGMIALGAAVAAVGLTPVSSFLWALVSMSCVGLIVPLVNGPVFAILQATIAPGYQGRVFSLVSSLAGAAAPLGLILAAPVAEIVGVGFWYLAAGLACVAMGIAGFFAPALMGIEDGAAEGVASMSVAAPSGAERANVGIARS
jgi:DHA3 family macrolide efflux protein-like MFS transporter